VPALGVCLLPVGRSRARALAAGLPRQDHVYNTTDQSFRFHHKKGAAVVLERWPQVYRVKIHVYSTTDQSFRFNHKKIDEMLCKLDSTEKPRSFEKYPTPPYYHPR